jgi:hypothetical protein
MGGDVASRHVAAVVSAHQLVDVDDVGDIVDKPHISHGAGPLRPR